MQSDVPLSSVLLDDLFTGGVELSTMLLVEIGLLLLLLIVSALLSSALRAFFSIDYPSLEKLQDQRNGASARVLSLLEKPGRLYMTLGLAIHLAHAGVIVLAVLIGLRIAAADIVPMGVVLAITLLLSAILIVLTTRVLPHLLEPEGYVPFARASSWLALWLHRLLLVLSIPMDWIAAQVFRWFGVAWPPRAVVTHLPSGHGAEGVPGDAEHDERMLISSVVAFSDMTVREIMTSRMDMVALPVPATLDEALDIIRTSGHSRLPLYEEHLDNILGIVYTKDILPFLDPSVQNGVHRIDASDIDWRKLARPPMFVPLGRPLNVLLQEFQRQKTHIAIVVDEYGGTAGLVTLENVLEEIVGDIRDEHDVENVLARKVGENVYRVDARMNLDDLSTLLQRDLTSEEFEFETLGGLVYHCAGDIPEEGDEISYQNLRMRVASVDNHRIVEVMIHVNPEEVMEDASLE